MADSDLLEPHAADFSVASETVDPSTAVITATGDLDVLTAGKFQGVIDQVLTGGVTRLVLDFSNLAFLDSTTIGVMVKTLTRLRRAGGEMAVVCTDPAILKLMEITRMHTMFEMCSSREIALRKLRGE